MTPGIHVAVIGGDPGGAEAVAPVLGALQSPDVTLHAFGYRQASAIWQSRGVDVRSVEEAATVGDCAALLRGCGADVLLLSTSSNGIDLEKKFVQAARELGVPSVAVLDLWTNYRCRFADASGAMAFLPDRVAIMDERAREEMAALDFPLERLVVTGQPAFDELAAWKRQAGIGFRAAIRESFGVQAGERFVVFGSQPLAAIYGDDTSRPGHPGYTEAVVVERLAAALEVVARESSVGIFLLIRPHPRESAQAHAAVKSDAIRIAVSSDHHRRELMLSADLVVGMTSAFLLEAVVLGCRTLSLQPGLRTRECLPTNLFGATPVVSDDAEIVPALRRALSATGPAASGAPAIPQDSRAAEKVAALVRSLACTAGQPQCASHTA